MMPPRIPRRRCGCYDCGLSKGRKRKNPGLGGPGFLIARQRVLISYGRRDPGRGWMSVRSLVALSRRVSDPANTVHDRPAPLTRDVMVAKQARVVAWWITEGRSAAEVRIRRCAASGATIW
jgi:hypothetical protein